MSGQAWIPFIADRLPQLWLRTGEHVVLTGVSTGMAVLVGMPLGLLGARARWMRGPLMGAIGVLQTIPSLAMLAILLALLQKIGAVPAIIALTLYALLPVARNTVAGMDGVPREAIDAARGIGMTPRQSLWLVELPLAMPVIVAGIRTAAVAGVGIATLSAFIGAGGLGQLINRGLALSDTQLIVLGAVPAAILALIVDGTIGAFGWALGCRVSPAAGRGTRTVRVLRVAAFALPVVLLAAGTAAYHAARPQAAPADKPQDLAAGTVTLRIGTKNFTEQFILGELMAQLVEAHSDLRVERRFNLGGTMICHGALKSGEIDVYPEYTGTALTAILQQPAMADTGQAYETVAREYPARFGAEWLRPYGFNNTYVLTVRKADAAKHKLANVSDLVPLAGKLRAGFTAEFGERPDGYPGLKKTYGLQFQEVRDLDPALIYPSIANGQCDVICAFATDGRIAAFDLATLTDDRGFFPPYQAAPVARAEILRAHPRLRTILDMAAGLIDAAAMQKLNYEVDEKKARPRDVAGDFLRDRGLL